MSPSRPFGRGGLNFFTQVLRLESVLATEYGEEVAGGSIFLPRSCDARPMELPQFTLLQWLLAVLPALSIGLLWRDLVCDLLVNETGSALLRD